MTPDHLAIRYVWYGVLGLALWVVCGIEDMGAAKRHSAKWAAAADNAAPLSLKSNAP